MSDYIFVFDLDSTISKKEILPTIAEHIGRQEEIRKLTEATMQGEISFRTSFLNRVDILKDIEVSVVRKIVKEIPLNENIARFILKHQERCYVVTGNLDVWICDLMKKIGLDNQVYCSKAQLFHDRISRVISVVDKELVAQQFVQPLVIIGDGDNDSGMARCADIAVGFGGVRQIAPSLMKNIDYAFYDDYCCAEFLESLI